MHCVFFQSDLVTLSVLGLNAVANNTQQLSLSEVSGSMSTRKLAGASLPDQKIALDNGERGGLSVNFWRVVP